MKGKLLLIFLIFFSYTLASQVDEQVIDESQLFSGQNAATEIQPSTSIVSSTSNFASSKESVYFSGEIIGKGTYSLNRNWLENNGAFNLNTLTTYAQTNLYLDVRLKNNFKAFLNTQLTNIAQSTAISSPNALAVSIKEAFMDMNLGHVIYFRAGKQVLQWGRAYFWNPTDVINVEKHNFMDLEQNREGAYGIKAHLPIGVESNYYAFWDMTNANNINQCAGAVKGEWVINNSEVALSTWKKIGKAQIYGIDYSTKLIDWDVKGETSLSYGDDKTRIAVNNGIVSAYTINNRWLYKSAINFSHYFSWIYSDQIQLSAEYFFNDGGYTDNIFASPIGQAYLLQNNLYEPNYHSERYGALFVSITKFPLSEMTSNLNCLTNLCDNSGIFTCGISYTPVDHATISATTYLCFGPPEAEYTWNGNRISGEISTSMDF